MVSSNVTQDGFVRRTNWNYPPWFFSEGRFLPGGPAWYPEDEATPAWMYAEANIMLITAITLVLLVMFLVVLPVIRYRLYSAITALNTIAIGFTIGMCMVLPEWARGTVDLESVMSHYEPTIYGMRVGVHIGLTYTNVTLNYRYKLPDNFTSTAWISHVSTQNFLYNEMIETSPPGVLHRFMPKILGRGMPTPILTVFHFLSASSLGFQWPHHIGEAGSHCALMLLFALLGWFLACLLTGAIPRYSCYAYIAIGALMILTVFTYFYWASVDIIYPCIVIEDQFLELKYGVCFWACLGVGVWSVIYGFTVAVFDLSHPDRFLTIFDFDYEYKRALARADKLNQHAPTSDSIYRG